MQQTKFTETAKGLMTLHWVHDTILAHIYFDDFSNDYGWFSFGDATTGFWELGEENAAEFLENSPVTVQGVDYFECEYSPHCTEGMELLSDLSNLEFTEDNYDFS